MSATDYRSLQIRVVSSFDEIEEIEPTWSDLAREVPFRSIPWYSAWWRAFGQGNRLFILSLFDGPECVGIAPWYIEKTAPVGNIIRFLASNEVCSDYQTILTKPGYEQSVAREVAVWLTQHVSVDAAQNADQFSGWDVMELMGVDAASPVMRSMVRNLETHGLTIHERSCQSCWRIPLANSIDEYVSTLSKPNRRRVRWALRRLTTPDCRVQFVRSREDFSPIWSEFVRLHQRRRHSLGQLGCFASGAFSNFLESAASSFFNDGNLDLACVSLGGKPVAAELCLRGSNATYAYQIGIDPDALSANPGWLINVASIQNAIELGQHGYDLCRGDDPYKRHLGAVGRPSVEFRIVTQRLRAQLWHTAWVTGTAMKDLIKNGLAITGIR